MTPTEQREPILKLLPEVLTFPGEEFDLTRPKPLEVLTLPGLETSFLTPSGLRTLPDITVQLQQEMASLDPHTALHQEMVLEVADSIFLHLIANLARSSSPQDVHELVKVYEACRSGILLHDLGKTGIDPDPSKSTSIINDRSPKDDHCPHVDHRSLDSIMTTELHSLISGLMLKECSKKHPELSESVTIAIGHHEHLEGKHYSPTNGKTFLSYPRSSARHLNPYLTLILSITQLADRATTLGQPRTYRPDRQPDPIIAAELLSILSTKRLTSIYGPLNPDQVDQITDFFTKATLKALHKSQQKHSIEDCLNPKLATSPSLLIPSLIDAVWEKHRERIKEQLLANSENHH